MSIKEKLVSGRFIMTVSFCLTYCFIMITCVIMVAKKIMALDVFLGLFTGFTAILMAIKDAYFHRSDRTQNGGAPK